MRLFKRTSKSLLDHNLFINNVNGVLQALSLNLVTPFAMLYAKRLGATDTDIAFLNSYPAIFSLLAVFIGTFLFRRYKNKKKVTGLYFGMARSFFIIFVFVPFMPKEIRPSLFVLLYGAMNFPTAVATMGWQSYLGDLFTNEWRGRAFSNRSTLSTACALVVTFITGQMLFYIPKTDGQRINMYQTFFLVAFVFGIFEVYSFTKHKLDKHNAQIETITEFKNEPLMAKFKSITKLISSNKKFLDYLVCVVCFHFAWQMGWALFFSYEVDVLHSNESWTSITATVAGITQAAAYPFWQWVSEKKGNNYAIFWAIGLMGLAPFFYVMSRNMYHVTIFTAVTGIAVAGTLLLLLNNLYEAAPNENRTLYIAIYTVLTNITLMFAPLIGMKLKSMFNIYIALIIVGTLRLSSALLFYFRYRKYNKIAKQ